MRAPLDASWTLPQRGAGDVLGATRDRLAPCAAGDPWQAYWETLPFRAALCRLEADDFVARFDAVVALQRDWRVLDFGCGFGIITALVARSVREVCAWDATPSMRAWAQRNSADCPNVQIIDAESDPRLSGDAEPYDLILVNSVIQYMRPPERRAWLRRWRALLAPRGTVVLSDLVSPRHRMWHDVASLWRFYERHGRLTDALRQRLGDLRRYRRARRVRRLSSVGREELRRDAAAAGLAVELLDANLTYRPHRIAALLRAE